MSDKKFTATVAILTGLAIGGTLVIDSIINAPQWPTVRIVWDYPPHGTNIVFRVYRAQFDKLPMTWPLIGETTNQWFIPPAAQLDFFGVKAFDTVTRLESDWGTVKP